MQVSGALHASLELSRALTKHCKIELAMMAEEDGLSTDGVLPIHRQRATLPLGFPGRGLPNKLRTPLLRSRLCELVDDGYDLVHLHNPMPTLELARVARACLSANVPYLISTHGFTELTSDGAAYGLGAIGRAAWPWLVTRPLRFVVQHAAGILALSPADFPYLQSVGVAPERITVVPNGVELPDEPPDAATIDEVLTRYGVPPRDGRARALFLGNHTKNKGLPVLLEAVLASTHPFVLIVGGAKRDQLDYDSYDRRCGDGQQIVFTDLVATEDMPALFASADLFVFPSLADTFPLAVLEAMAHGLGVLATQVGGIPHQVTPECGVLVPPGDAAALRAAFDKLVCDLDLVREMGQHGRQRARDNFTWEGAANIAYAAYSRVLEGENAAAS
jgi:glycosyltransferase involved in cell wall biosynthesis